MLATVQSTDFVIDARKQVQSYLVRVGFQPTKMDLPTFTRVGGPVLRANLAFGDRPLDRRMRD